MTKTFKRGDRVAWNSEAGRVTGIVQKKITSEIVFRSYKRHASKQEPQYIIKSVVGAGWESRLNQGRF